MSILTALLDDSGSLTDPYGAFVVTAVVMTEQSHELSKVITRAWRRYTARKGKRPPIDEFKFHEVERQDSERVLRRLAQTEAELLILIVNKGQQRIADTVENYAVLETESLEMCQQFHVGQPFHAIRDRHFSKLDHQVALDRLTGHWMGPTVTLSFVDSKTSPLIKLADFVAGAFHRKYSRGDSSLAEVVATLVVAERVVLWKDLRRKWLERGEKEKW